MKRIALLLALGIGGAAIVVAGWYWYRFRPFRIERPAFATTLDRVTPADGDFDLAYQLPGSPLGIATDGRELMIAARTDPWGVMRVRRDDDDFEAKQIAILEPQYQQKMQIDALTWNGTHYVGYTSSAWFERSDERVFTIHDPATMRVIEHRPAPDHLGCLAWDGSMYWAATRRNTADSPEPAHLFRLDHQFNVIATLETPGVGCQGLAWDGRHLWFADVFSDAIHVIDVSSGTSRVVHSSYSELSYLSGVAAFEGEIWITDYDRNHLSRIRPSTRVAWSSGQRAEPVRASAITTAEPAAVVTARHENRFAQRAPDAAEEMEWSIELRDGAVWGSWKLWFGHDLFTEREQASGPVTIPKLARYEVTVYLPFAAPEVKHTFDATPGENVQTKIRLADATSPGEYRVNLFLHVQYVTADGTGKILNNSAGSLTVKK